MSSKTKAAQSAQGARLRALYVRVSTEAQAEEGYSVAAQAERLSAYCKAMGWEERELYIDGGFSGSNLDRPEMQRLIEDARAGRLASVLVYKLDRLSRSQKDTLHLIEDVFLPNGVDFISLNESIDTSTPYGRAMIGILSAFAQLERENIFMRTRMGMLERVRQGYWPGGGGAPFGYDYDSESGCLVPNGDAETVRRIYELYIRGYSAQRIASLLGLRYEKLVTQILTRRTNLGLIPYKGEEYPGRHEPLIDEASFELAMRKMRERSSGARAPAGEPKLLSGLIYCGYCGARLRYIRWGKRGYKLRCYSRDRSKPYMQKDEDCAAPAVWAAEVEELVLSDLFRLSVDLGGDFAPPLPDPAEALEARLRQAEARLRRLYNLYAEGGDETLRAAIEENRAALEALRAELSDGQALAKRSGELAFLREQAAQLSRSWDYLAPLERQSVLRDCVEKILVFEDRVEIYYTFAGVSSRTVAA